MPLVFRQFSSRRLSSMRRAVGVAMLSAVSALGVVACSSDDTGDDDPPADSGTVVPPDPNGVDGGVPVDNLNPAVADTTFQGEGDMDGDGEPES